MEVILIQGHSNTGKTTLCKIIKDCLIKVGFELEKDKSGNDLKEIEDNKEKDFRGIYVHKKCKSRIIINSGSDLTTIIQKFEKFYCKNRKNGYDVFISAIRPEKTIINNHNVHDELKNIYENDFKGEEYVIDLDAEKIENEDLDFCEFIEKVLKEKANEILGKIKLSN